MSHLSLALQSTYHSVEIALFSKERCLETRALPKFEATKETVPVLNDFLNKKNITLKDLLYISANQGPAPFTTLRVVITTVNGISFASHIPLVGVDGLATFALAHSKPNTPTVALLNAYNNDVYFAITQDEKIQESGYNNIDLLLQTLQSQNRSFYMIGNGVALYKEKIKEYLGGKVLFSANIPEFCSIEQLGKSAWHLWSQQKEKKYKLLPLYLKTYNA